MSRMSKVSANEEATDDLTSVLDLKIDGRFEQRHKSSTRIEDVQEHLTLLIDLVCGAVLKDRKSKHKLAMIRQEMRLSTPIVIIVTDVWSFQRLQRCSDECTA